MPRIDPIQLLKCLSVLLSPTGGIKSRGELERLARLMTKFSKKLVSKCIYIQILKCTETDLLGVFMDSGGWRLFHGWLTESIVTKNWPLVRELLELLLLCPVDIERLKANNCPKLVKELSKDGNQLAIRALASKLVEQWLRTVKGENVEPIRISDIPQIVADISFQTADIKPCIESDKNNIQVEHKPAIKEETLTENIKQEVLSPVRLVNGEESNNGDIKNKEEFDKEDSLPVLKITMKDGKQIISQVEDSDNKQSGKIEKSKHRSKEKPEKSSSSTSKSSSSKHSSKHSSNEKHKSSSHKSSSSSSPSRHHSKDKKDKDKEKRSSHSSSSKSSSRHSDSSKKSSSSSSRSSSKDDKSNKSGSEAKEDKSKDKEEKKDSKDEKKDSKEEKKNAIPVKLEDTPSIMKLGKIPKLSDIKREKPSISIEVRKPDEPKPKTVKTFHAKFRKHGLEEEIKPPPSRASLLNKKVPPVLPPTVSLPVPKRPSPVHSETPPEKKIKIIEPVEKPGAIKLIPAKPKPMLLLESDMFMDALNASATNKKEPKKRKRRTSGSKDGNPNDASPPHTPSSGSPSSESKSVPPKFYQDTLEAEDDKDKSSDKESDSHDNDNAEITTTPTRSTKKKVEPPEPVEPHTLTVNGLKGVLCYHKRKGPKKSIKWKTDSELEEVQYFELDETERVNVTKNFTDMSHLERVHEREAFQKSRNITGIDDMEEKTRWRPLIPFEPEGQIAVEYGKNSKEKDIQATRQKSTLQPLYFAKSMIPDSPLEADPETHLYSEPNIIPLEDVTGNQDNISDFRNMPWPEPKGNAPPSSSSNINVPSMFPSNIPQFPNGFPTQFPGVPGGFQGPAMVPSDWPAGVPPMMPNGMPPSAMGVMPPGAIPPGIMVPPEAMMMGPEMFAAGTAMFGPVPPEGFNMMENMMGPNMFPPDFNMAAAQAPPDGFPGSGGFRGNMRGRGASGGVGGGSGGHWRGKGAGNWDGPQRGRGGHSRGGRKAVCIYFQRKGSCRQGDNCTFLHPGVNCPY